ncbi:MAG: hypothetical protein RLZZ502_265 [Pseudomonadota bacterium]|jgi:hypothetical protein
MLPPPSVNRKRLHQRQVRYEGHQRDDGLWDLDCYLTDAKDADYTMRSGVRPVGSPVHDLAVRLTYKSDGEITEVVAASNWMAYPGHCERTLPDFKRLIGLSLKSNFRLHLLEKMGAARGCTHFTELLAWAPSAAIQTWATNKADYDPESATKPFQLDRCHALASNSPTVAEYYPKWYKPESLSL